MLVVEEKIVPRTVRVVTPIALWAMTLLAIPHDIDTLTVWTMNLYIGHRILLYEQGQRCHSISMSTHLKHHRGQGTSDAASGQSAAPWHRCAQGLLAPAAPVVALSQRLWSR